MDVAAAVLSGFALAAAAPWIVAWLGRSAGWGLALLPLGLAGFFARMLPQVARGEIASERTEWAPSLGVELSFRIDGLGLLFALLITGIGGLIAIYAGGYLKGHPRLGRFYLFLLSFMASMLGLVLADNVILLYVFWELTSLTSYLLIGFDSDRAEARAAALQALLVTGAGGLALLAGLVLLGSAGGSYELSELLARGDAIRGHVLYLPILTLLLAGAFTKSAQFPFHFWLPGAMQAPTPVSAYLHSATMVKAGVYLLARAHPFLGGTLEWTASVTAAGAATAVVGSWLSLTRTDLKQVLAYSTCSALGLLVMLLGVGSDRAIQGMAAFLLAHALYKGALFMLAGAIDHETGTRDTARLGGLRKAMPVTALAAFVAAASMAALPPALSFLGKETLLEALWTREGPGLVLVAVAVAMSAASVAVALNVGVRPFAGAYRDTPHKPHEAPPSLWLGPLILGAAGIAAGFWPEAVARHVVGPVASSVVGTPIDAKLELWHGPTPALGLSGLSLALGVAAFLGRGAILRLADWLAPLMRLGPARWYEWSLAGMISGATALTNRLQSGRLRNYLRIVLATSLVLTGTALAARDAWIGPEDWADVHFYEAGLAALIALAALAAALARSHLAAVAALGMAGYGVALIFVINAAPDLAMTQFLVETLTVILFVLVFYRLRPESLKVERTFRLGDLVLVVGVGAATTLFAWTAVAARDEGPISHYFARHSHDLGHGRNVVNVILVDFRGIDTLGEISVLAAAAIGVFAILRRGGRR